MNKRILYILFVGLLLGIMPAMSQKPRGNHGGERWRKEMREFKLKFLAQEMELQEDQQKQFFTLYTQMTDDKDAIMRTTRQTLERVEKMDSPSDADYRAASEALMKAREQELAVDKKFEEKFRVFLSPKQLFKMKEAERKFRDRLRDMKHNRPHHRPAKKCK